MQIKKASAIFVVFLLVASLAVAGVPCCGYAADAPDAFGELTRGVTCALEHYSNVHRGTGQNSMISTALFERARDIVREHMGLGDDHEVIFGTIWGIYTLIGDLKPGAEYTVIYSDRDTGLRFAVAALGVKKEFLPDAPPITGGGEVDDVGDTTVDWSDAPEKYEAGTPNITGVITLAKALTIMRDAGDKDVFRTGHGRKPGEKEETDPYGDARGMELIPKVRATVVGLDTLVPTEEGEVRYINLDNGASTPAFTPVMQDAFQALRATDDEARRIVEDAKAECAAYFNAPVADYGCIFSLNTTESINIAGVIAATLPGEGTESVVINTDLEHNSNELPWRHSTLIHLPVNEDGFMDLADLERILKEYNETKSHGNKRITVVTVSGASNVLGTFNDIGAIGRLAKRYGAYFHVDAAQLAAHREVDMAKSGIDMLSCSGHKMYAPFGTGCLMVRKTLLTKVAPDTLGKIRESGDRNLMGIAALKRSMRILKKIGLDILEKEEAGLTARVLRGIDGINRAHGAGTVDIFGIQDPSALDDKGPVVCFYVDGIPHNIVATRLAEIRGIGVRDGCFCAHRLLKFLFQAQGKDVSDLVRAGKAPGLTRVSIGLENTADDIDAFLGTLVKIIQDPDSKKFVPGEPNCRYCAGKSLVTHEITEKIGAFVQGVVRQVYGPGPS